MQYLKLFSRGKIGSLELKNRIVMPPIGVGFAAANGEASDECIRYYEERAKGGCGLIITEITRIDDETGIGQLWQLSATHARYVQRLIKLADAVHRHDSKIFLQLHHAGREIASRFMDGRQQVAPSPIPCGVIKEMPRELTTDECEELVKKFISGAVIAKRSGMDGIELHAAHGYLINQFMSSYSNKRADKYGGDFENRMRFIAEIITGVRRTCGHHFPICVRISADEFIEGGLKIGDSVKIAKYLENKGVDAIDVSCGTYESGYTNIESYFYSESFKKPLAKAVRQSVKIPVIAVSLVKHPVDGERLLEEGVTDFVAVGRGHLADPQWANKSRDGKEDLIRKCIGCMSCIKTTMGGRPAICTVNPCLGRETIYGGDMLVRNGDGRTAAVIGGGPAGMQAAYTLSKRNFKVVLLEKEARLGGTLNLADKPPHKELITELIETQKNELKTAGVEVRLNTKATVDDVKALNPYGVIIAAGGSPIVPNIPGVNKDWVCKAEDVLADRVSFNGRKILVIGGGVTGLETAEILSADNEVTIAEMTNYVGSVLYPIVRIELVKRLKDSGVKIITGQAVSEIGEGAVMLRDSKSGLSLEVKADQVVLAVGVRPNSELTEEFRSFFDKVITVGDSSVSGQIADAMKEANDKAFVF